MEDGPGRNKAHMRQITPNTTPGTADSALQYNFLPVPRLLSGDYRTIHQTACKGVSKNRQQYMGN